MLSGSIVTPKSIQYEECIGKSFGIADSDHDGKINLDTIGEKNINAEGASDLHAYHYPVILFFGMNSSYYSYGFWHRSANFFRIQMIFTTSGWF